MKSLGQYSKAIGALITGVLGWAAVVVASKSGPISSAEWLALGTACLPSLAAFGLTNTTPGLATVAESLATIASPPVDPAPPVVPPAA